MKRVDKTVLRETAFVAAGTFVLSVLLNAILLIIRKWTVSLLLGNVIGAFIAVLNFFLMGLTVQSSVGKDEKQIQTRVRFSFVFRELLIIAAAVVVLIFRNNISIITFLVSLFFPRLTINMRSFIKLPGDDAVEDSVVSVDPSVSDPGKEDDEEDNENV